MVKTDPEMLNDLGRFLQTERLRKNITQQELAIKSGLGRRTITQLENGKTLTSLLKVLYALKRQDVWDIFSTSPIISPLLMAKLIKKPPRRARKRKVVVGDVKPLNW
jgi:transcriptional regulator with XRE-family HTH domain